MGGRKGTGGQEGRVDEERRVRVVEYKKGGERESG